MQIIFTKTIKSKVISPLFSLCFLFIFASCKDETLVTPVVPEDKTTISLAAEDNGINEVWLKVSLSNLLTDNTIKIFRDKQLAKEFSLAGKDTTICVSELSLSTSYTWQAKLYKDTVLKKESESIVFKTLDSTNHNVNWTSYKIAEYGQVNDIAIINQDTIWAVGLFFDNYNNPPYNLAIWNGIRWSLQRINYNSSQDTSVKVFYSIFPINSNDIWVAGKLPVHWDGNAFKTIELTSAIWSSDIHGIWGTNSNNIYFCGTKGKIGYYNGSTWTSIYTSLSNLTFKNITGDKEGSKIWVTGAAYPNLSKTAFLCIENKIVKQLYYGSGENGAFLGLYTNKPDRVYVVKGGVLLRQVGSTSLNTNEIISFENFDFSSLSISANSINDMFSCGYGGVIEHFNGKSVTLYSSLKNPQLIFNKVSVKGNVMAAGGYMIGLEIGAPYVVIGKR